MDDKKNALYVAEAVSILATVVGTIASEVTRYTVFLSAPLTVSLALSLINRRSNEPNGEQTEVEIQQLREQLLNLNQAITVDRESIRQQLLALPTPPEPLDLTEVQGTLSKIRAEIENRLVPLEALDPRAIQDRFTQVQTEVERLRSDLQEIAAEPLTELVLLQEELDRLADQFEQSPSQTESPLVPQVEELKTALTRLEEKVDHPAPVPTPDMDALMAELRQFQLPSPVLDLTPLVSEIRQMQQQQSQMEQSILHAIRSELQLQPAVPGAVPQSGLQEGLTQLQTEMSQLRETLQVLGDRVAAPASLEDNVTWGQLLSLSLRNSRRSMQSLLKRLAEALKDTPEKDNSSERDSPET